MKKEEVIRKINEAVECLYQNKEKVAMQRVANLLPFFHNMAQDLMEKGDNGVIRVMDMLKDLMENYNHYDMLGMADCLCNDAYSLVEMYEKE